MASPPTLLSLSDPCAVAKLQILIVPVQLGSQRLPEATYEHWASLIRRHASVRVDELNRPSTSSFASHARGSADPHPRRRFFPATTATSISRANANNHVHLSFPSHPPARHLYPLSLLRMTLFPLVVIGVAIAPEFEGVQGYSVDGQDDSGAIPEAFTPTAPTSAGDVSQRPSCQPSDAFDQTLDNLFPPTSPFPLVRRLMLVPPQIPRSPTSMPSTARPQGEPVPLAAGSKGKKKDEGDVRWAPTQGSEAWLSKLLGEVVGDVLEELGELATALETPQGLKTLSATRLPSLTATLPKPALADLIPTTSPPSGSQPQSRSGTPTSSLPHSQSLDHLSSVGMGITLTRALAPGGRPTSVQPPSLPPVSANTISPTPAPVPIATSNPFRRSTALSSPFSRTSSAASITMSSSPSPAPAPAAIKYTSATLTGLAGGRLMKVLGDIYLLVGMYGDAIKCFEDGAERCRVVGDVLWEASAREARAVAGIGEAWEARDGSDRSQAFSNSPIPVEILAHYLSALACLSRSPLPYPPTILSPSPQAVSGSLAIPGPSSNQSNYVGTGEGLLAYLYTGMSLRISHFLLIIWSAGGWGSIALSSLMAHTLPRTFILPLDGEAEKDDHARRKRRRYLTLLSSRSQLTRNSIYGHTTGALGPHHRAMTKSEQLTVHVEAIWLARWLDLPRHEAVITREVVKRIGVMVAEGREETRRLLAAGFSHSKGVADTAASEASVGLGLGMPVAPSQTVAVRRKESTVGNEAVLRLFERASGIMGVNLLSWESRVTNTSIFSATEMERPPKFGWPELQVEMLKEGIAVAEALPDLPAVIIFCLSALKALHPYLNPTSQGHLAKMFPLVLATVRRRGTKSATVPWWVPGKMVLSVEIASLAPNRMPVEHSAAEIAPAGKKDPFLYNPRFKATEAGRTMLVANEQVDVFVTLSNPLAFDLELADLSLVTTGVPFRTSPVPLIIPATSVQTVRVSGLASSAGTMQVRGVSVRLTDGSSTEVLLPIIDDKAKQRADKWKSRAILDGSKIKRMGFEARFSASRPDVVLEGQRESGMPEDRWLDCKVVEEQPLLWIRKTSLTHGTVMLYNGESSTIRITLENSSSTPVDFIKLSFDDSTIREALALVSEGELGPERAYELDWDTVHRPVFSWDQPAEVNVPPGGRTTLVVRCLGKVGCTDGSIRIDYGYINRPTDSPHAFYTRQITFPVLFTVYHTLEINQLDIIRLVGASQSFELPKVEGEEGHLQPNGDAKSQSQQHLTPDRKSSTGMGSELLPPLPSLTPRRGSFAVGEELLKQRMEEESDERHCLVSVGVRNVYGVPFEVTLTRGGEDEPLVSARLVPPGATERIIIPLPRLSLSKETLAKPIPALTDRQYVVAKTKKTAERLAHERELFWYREEMLRRVTASWVEPGSLRQGALSLRDQSLLPDMLDVLRQDQVEVRLVVSPRQGDKVKVMEFVDVSIIVTNRLERPIQPRVRIEPLSPDSWAAGTSRRQGSQPSAFAQAKHMVFDGILSAVLPTIPDGGQGEHTLGAIFLARGEFAFRAVVEELRPTRAEGNAESVGERAHFSQLLRVTVS